RIDDKVSNVHALRTELTRHRFRQDALRRLGRGKAGKGGLAPQCRRVAGGDDGTVTRLDHGGSKSAREIEQPHRVDLKVAVQNGRGLARRGCGRQFLDVRLQVGSEILVLQQPGEVGGHARIVAIDVPVQDLFQPARLQLVRALMLVHEQRELGRKTDVGKGDIFAYQYVAAGRQRLLDPGGVGRKGIPRPRLYRLVDA